MIKFPVHAITQTAQRSLIKRDYKGCLDLLRTIPSSEKPREMLTQALCGHGKECIAKGDYKTAKNLFAEASTLESRRVAKALLQERKQLLNRILRRQQTPVTGLDKEYRNARVLSPKRLPSGSFAPLIWFVGCPASYRSKYDLERDAPLSSLLRMMKSGVEVTTIEHLGCFLAAFIHGRSPVLSRVDVVIPVPSDPARAAQRGYSISNILAKQISVLCAVPLHEDLIAVSGEAPELRQIPKYMRSTAIKGVYKVQREDHFLKDLSVLVVDDVITSGSTVSEIARVLKEHGAGEVAAVALAHTERSII